MNNLEKFRELGISEATLEALDAKGFKEPSLIQSAAIPLLLSGKCDVIGQAQTGTGKTAAFGIPIIEIITPRLDHVQAIILSPTRELTMQIAEELNSLQGGRGLSILAVYGGSSIEMQLKRLGAGVDIIVGTPGRVMDLMRRGALDLTRVTFAVLDEADEMLNMGFLEDMEAILAETPADKRMLMFSATMPKPILNIAAKFMREYELVAVAHRQATVESTEQVCYEVRREHKLDALGRIIDIEPNMYGMVFCRTKIDVDDLAARLGERGYAVEALHGDIAQAQRTKVIDRFKRRKFLLLIATDVAARGIDVNDLTHVINYSLPQSSEAYLHRIGRTGRAGKAGKAITFVTPSEARKLTQIKRELKVEIPKCKLPSPLDIVKRKKECAMASLRDIIASEIHLDYLNFAEELLEEINTVELVAAILRQAYKKEMLPESYAELASDKPLGLKDIEDGSQVRLFVAAGKHDGFGPGKILDLIWEKTGIRSSKIGRIDCFDKFSFVNVSSGHVGKLLDAFRHFGPGKAPFMDIARESEHEEESEEAPPKIRKAKPAAEEKSEPEAKSLPAHKADFVKKPKKKPFPSKKADFAKKADFVKKTASDKKSKKKKTAPPPPWVEKRIKGFKKVSSAS